MVRMFLLVNFSVLIADLTIQSTKSLPPCPNFDKNTHTENAWTNLSGQGDAPDDPYPNEK